MINKKISVGNFVISKHFAFFIFLYPDLVFFISLVFLEATILVLPVVQQIREESRDVLAVAKGCHRHEAARALIFASRFIYMFYQNARIRVISHIQVNLRHQVEKNETA